jgi:hypothetical protein
VRSHCVTCSLSVSDTRCAEVLQGDTVVIRNCPPISARKRFRVETIVSSPEHDARARHEKLAAEAEAKEAETGIGAGRVAELAKRVKEAALDDAASASGAFESVHPTPLPSAA